MISFGSLCAGLGLAIGGEAALSLWPAQTLATPLLPAKRERIYRGPADDIQQVAENRDGRVAVVAWDGKVLLWGPDGGGPRGFFQNGPFRAGRIALSPDGRFLAVSAEATFRPAGVHPDPGESRQQIVVHDLSSARRVLSIDCGRCSVRPIVFSPDGKRIFAGGFDGFISVWDSATGRCLRRAPAGERAIFTVALSPDGKKLASGSNGRVKVWEAETGKLLREWAPTDSGNVIFYLAFSPDGRLLAAAERGPLPGTKRSFAAIAVHSVETGLPECVIPGPPRSRGFKGVAFHPDGKRLVVADWYECGVAVFNPISGKRIDFRETPNRPVALSLSQGGRVLAALADGTIREVELPER